MAQRGKVQIGRMADWPISAGSSLELPPEKSVLRYKVKFTEADFVRLADVFFAELEKRYLQAKPKMAHD